MLIIPVCGESKEFVETLMSQQQHQNVLLILIVNRPKGHIKTNQWQIENGQLIRYLESQFKNSIDLSHNHQLLTQNNTRSLPYDVLLLNFNDSAFDSNKGVGLARKIAADTALSLIAGQVVKSPWIFSTDADVILPEYYFAVVDGVAKDIAALSLKFKHKADNKAQQRVQQQYDFKLKYYQSGVRYIGVEYDYIPLGSTLVIAANNYAQVRGFPCRSGGEDFYILNKLAKTGLVVEPQFPIVEIKSRFSDRVPFGTGPAIIKLQEQERGGDAMIYYHPRIFHVLKAWHSAIKAYYEKQSFPDQDFGLNEHWKLDQVLLKAQSQIKTNDRWQQFIHEWFDAFKVLKSVHFLNTAFGSVIYEDLIELEAYRDILRSERS